MSQPCPLNVHQKHLKGKKSLERGWVIRLVVWLSSFDSNFCRKDGLFLSPNILGEIKDLSNNWRKPSKQDHFVDEQTRMKWKYGWHVWKHLSFFTILLSVFVLFHPRSSALILGPRPPSHRPSAPEYCKTKYNTTI